MSYLGKPKYKRCKNPKYERFVKEKACVICGKSPVHGHHTDHARRCSVMLIPLCPEHHLPGFPDSYHTLEREKFETRHNINCDWICLNLLSEFLDEEKDYLELKKLRCK